MGVPLLADVVQSMEEAIMAKEGIIKVLSMHSLYFFLACQYVMSLSFNGRKNVGLYAYYGGWGSSRNLIAPCYFLLILLNNPSEKQININSHMVKQTNEIIDITPQDLYQQDKNNTQSSYTGR